MRLSHAGAVLALLLAGCQMAVPPVDVEMLDPRVAAGPARSCAELELSDVRCTLLTLRAASELEATRPDADVASTAFHEAAPAPAGASAVPASQVVPVVVVFTMTDGTKVGVPVLCPRDAGSTDQACNPRVQ